MQYGVSYYPEHKTEDELRHDLELLKVSGINTVRMGEFAWSRFEPSEGDFHFEWLDRVIAELGEFGIKTIVCTPTACPPIWLVEKHPDILYMDGRGVRRPFGGRRHYCYSNKDYREYSAAITAKMAEHYGSNPNVSGFQIDNEPAQEGTGRCCCPVCTDGFQKWMKEKYVTIEEFNRRSGGAFWSQEYTSFGQISPPVNQIEAGAQPSIRLYYENPTIKMDFERFSSDAQIEYQNIQTDILRRSTKYCVTTNATGLATNSIDYYDSTMALDCYAFDYYPGLRNSKIDSFPYAFARGIKKGKPFWVLEFVSGGGHRLGGSGRLQPNPGAMKQSVVHSMAHGAEMMLHFQFRTFPFGAEQLNYAIVDMDGVPRRRFQEMQDTAAMLKRLAPYEKAGFAGKAAVIFDYDSHWALRIKPVNDPEFNYVDFCDSFYNSLLSLGITADVLSVNADLSDYKLVILPAAIVLSPERRNALKVFVENGGVLLATFLTSVKNRDNVGYTDVLPAGLTDLFGVEVQEVEPVQDKNRAVLSCGSKDKYWSELISGEAEMCMTYASSWKSGQGIVSRNSYGKGIAYYLGTGLEETALKEFLEKIAAEAGIQRAPFEALAGVEIVDRILDGKHIYYLFNFTTETITMPLIQPMQNLLTKDAVSGAVAIEPHGFVLLEQKGAV